MDFKIIWAAVARDDLREIVSYVSRDNPEAARKLGEDLLLAVEVLRSMPESGRKVPERNDVSIRELVRGKYRIIHKVVPEERRVEVWRIWHGARGEPKFRA